MNDVTNTSICPKCGQPRERGSQGWWVCKPCHREANRGNYARTHPDRKPRVIRVGLDALTFAPGVDESWYTATEHLFQQLLDRSGSEKTVKLYRYHIVSFFGSVHKHPENVTRQDVLTYLYKPCADQNHAGLPPSQSTINARLCSINRFYKFMAAYTIEGPDGKPTPLCNVPSPGLGIGYPKFGYAFRALSVSELERLFAAIPTNTVKGKRDRAALLFYVYSCRRREELARLLWKDLSDGTIIDEGGSSRQGHLYHWKGKGRSRIDDSDEIVPPVWDAIMDYLQSSGRLEHMTPDSPLFTATKGEKWKSQPLDSCTLTKHLKKYAREASLDASKISLHVLRHSGAKLRFEAGSDLLSIARRLRHTSLEHTQRYIQRLTTAGDEGFHLIEGRLSGL